MLQKNEMQQFKLLFHVFKEFPLNAGGGGGNI
jgi:hypothetical protein